METTPLTSTRSESDLPRSSSFESPNKLNISRVQACIATASLSLLLLLLLLPSQAPGAPSRQSGSRFTHTQFLGFGINTGAASSASTCKNSTTMGYLEPSTLQCYLGLPSPELDVYARLRVMQEAVETALGAADPDPKVLKVFIAPEFFFRGPSGAYDATSLISDDDSSLADEASFNEISAVVKGLESMVSAPDFGDWVFVFGTIIAAARDSVGDDGIAGTKDDSYLFFNFAPILQGGVGGKRMLAPKEYVSKIDFLRPTVGKLPWAFDVTDEDLRGTHHYDYDLWFLLSDYLEEVRGYSLVRRNFFEVEGVRMTLEICLDHAAGEAASNFLQKGGGIIDGIEPPQISLISSAGMKIMTKNLIIPPGGAVYHQDGLYDKQARAVIRDLVDGVDPNVEPVADKVLDHVGSLFDYEELGAKSVVHLWGGDDILIKKNTQNLFVVKSEGDWDQKPRIVTFPKIKLPNNA